MTHEFHNTTHVGAILRGNKTHPWEVIDYLPRECCTCYIVGSLLTELFWNLGLFLMYNRWYSDDNFIRTTTLYCQNKYVNFSSRLSLFIKPLVQHLLYFRQRLFNGFKFMYLWWNDSLAQNRNMWTCKLVPIDAMTGDTECGIFTVLLVFVAAVTSTGESIDQNKTPVTFTINMTGYDSSIFVMAKSLDMSSKVMWLLVISNAFLLIRSHFWTSECRHIGVMASQITSDSIVCSTVKENSKAHVRGIHRGPVVSPTKGQQRGNGTI